MCNDIDFPKFPKVEEIKLTKTELHLLKKISRHNAFSLEKARIFVKKHKRANAVARLLFTGLIDDNHNDTYSINARGTLWLDYHNQDIIAKWLPLSISYILSIAAIIISIVTKSK